MKTAKAVRHREPTRQSLDDIPEIDFSNRRVRRNPYAKKIAEQGATVQVGRGRPKKLFEVGGTHPRSVRFPDAVWKKLEKQAQKRGITLHAALREAILAWLKDVA